MHGLYISRSSPLHRLNPLTKLVAALAATVVLLAILSPYFPAAFFSLALVPLSFWGRVGKEFLGGIWRIILPIAVPLAVVQGLFYPGGTTPLLAIGSLSFKVEGLEYAFAVGTRLAAIAGVYLLLLQTTSPAALMMALVCHGLSPMIAYVIITTLQIIPQVRREAITVIDAQRSRALETDGDIRVRLEALLPLVAPLILRTLMGVEKRAMALEARAFTAKGPKTSIVEIPDTRWEASLRVMLIGLAVVAVILGVLLR